VCSLENPDIEDIADSGAVSGRQCLKPLRPMIFTDPHREIYTEHASRKNQREFKKTNSNENNDLCG